MPSGRGCGCLRVLCARKARVCDTCELGLYVFFIYRTGDVCLWKWRRPSRDSELAYLFD